MRKNKLQRKALLEADAESRDSLLKASYNFSDQDLGEIRRQGTLRTKILHGAEIFYDLLSSKFNIKDISAQFTITNLVAIISDEWDNPRKRIWTIGSKISRYFKSSFNLRKMCGISSGNIKRAKKIYPKIEASQHDRVRGVTIPETIGLNMHTLFALYLTRGSLYNLSSGQFNLTAKKQDEALFKNVLGPLIKQIFNIEDIAEQAVNGKNPWSDGVYRKTKCKMDVNSKAHYTFLRYVMNFPYPKRDVSVPVHNNYEHNYATLAGLVAGMGAFVKNGLMLYHNDGVLVESTKELAKKLGLNPQRYNKPFRTENNQSAKSKIVFRNGDIEKMASNYIEIDPMLKQCGMFINPDHYKRMDLTI